MRFIGWNLVLATWLMISAFVLPHTPFSQATTWIGAVVIGTAAFVAGGKPGVRFVITAVAVAFALIALLVPGMSAAAVVNNLLVAALLFALSIVKPVHHAATEARS